MDACYTKNMLVEEKKKLLRELVIHSGASEKRGRRPTSIFLSLSHCVSLSPCRFCVGDKFFLKNNMILCQLDYEGGHLPNGGGEMRPQ